MRVQEIIRSILDMIDGAETTENIPRPDEPVPNEHFYDDDVRRFRQIVDLADQGQETEYSNTPKEEYASIEAVTTAAGGGVNGPKHPADIKTSTQSMYPGKLYGTK
jgi:hypothetical protein